MKQYSNKTQLNYENVIASVLNAVYFIVIIIALIYLLFCNVYLVRKVEENSMQPLLNEQGVNTDIVYVNKYHKELKHGDIIVLDGEDKSIIKRVIALPGDTIDILYNPEAQAYMVYRNSEFIEEDYIKIDASKPDSNGMWKAHLNFTQYKADNTDKLTYLDGKMQYKLKDTEIFLLGDNRLVSEDSSTHGTYDISKVLGVVEYIQKDKETNIGIMCNYIFTFKWLNTLQDMF